VLQEVPLGPPVESMSQAWGLIKFAALGVVLLFLGGCLMTPTFWSDPKNPTFGDLVIGLGTGSLGALILALIGLLLVFGGRASAQQSPEASEKKVLPGP